MPDFYPQAGLSFRNNREKVKRRRQIISVFMKFGLDYLLMSRVSILLEIYRVVGKVMKIIQPRKATYGF